MDLTTLTGLFDEQQRPNNELVLSRTQLEEHDEVGARALANDINATSIGILRVLQTERGVTASMRDVCDWVGSKRCVPIDEIDISE